MPSNDPAQDMKPKRLHPVTSDRRRTFDIRDIARAGGFRRRLDFPLMGIRSSRDYVEIYSTIDRTRPPQIILIEWRRITFGLKPFFNCPQCSRRAVILYSDSLRSYCRHCAGLWFPSQRQHRRTRLKLKARKIRAALDNSGAPRRQASNPPLSTSAKDLSPSNRQAHADRARANEQSRPAALIQLSR